MKQKIADGIMKWLQDEAPSSFKVSMTFDDVRNLTQAICNQFGAENFDCAGKSSLDAAVKAEREQHTKRISELESALVQIRDMTDLEMRDGDTARNIAVYYIGPHPFGTV